MAKWMLLAAAAGGASALINLGTSLGSPLALMLSHLTHLPLFLAGLGIGATGAVFAGGAGTLIVGLIAGPYAGFVFFTFDAVPVAILCRQALLSRAVPGGQTEWYPGGLLLLWLAGIVAVYVLALALYLGLAHDGIVAVVRGALQQYIDGLGSLVHPDSAELLLALAPYVPGIMACYFMLTVIFNGALAQHLLRRSGRNLRPSVAFFEIELPRGLLYVLAAAIAAAYLSGTFGHVALTLAFIVALAYFLLGLAVVHAFLRMRPNRGTALFSFYVIFILLMVLFSPVGLAIVGLGVVEQLLGLRHRFAQQTGGEEEE
ncbi:MAG: DUF2232 domain-containing protein [Alphaproteobacteria bacterium]|jgi:hypothetical protein|nr:DUF2232 domain-containing protein [Alphaproteobacteria bacterium]